MSLMMTVSQMTREGHHGQVGGRALATLAVNRGLFLGAPRPVEGHRRQWPSWPSIISYPVRIWLGEGQIILITSYSYVQSASPVRTIPTLL